MIFIGVFMLMIFNHLLLIYTKEKVKLVIFVLTICIKYLREKKLFEFWFIFIYILNNYGPLSF